MIIIVKNTKTDYILCLVSLAQCVLKHNIVLDMKHNKETVQSLCIILLVI